MEQKSMKKKVGAFFIALLPAVASVILQVIALFLVQIPAMIIAMSNGILDIMSSTYAEDVVEWAKSISPIILITYHVVGTIVFAIWLHKSNRKSEPVIAVSFRKTTGMSIILAVVCGAALCFFSSGTVYLESHLMPAVVDKFNEMSEIAGFGGNPITIFSAVVLAPIGEELLCRGLTLKYAKKCFGNFWIANIMQAIVFGCIHGNLVQGIYAFVIGLVLGWLVEEYDTLVPAMVLHLVVNASTFTWVNAILNKVFPGEQIPSLRVSIAMVLLFGAITIGALYAGKQKKSIVC